MVLKRIILTIGLVVSATNLFGQTNRLFIPFLEKESQSNVVVTFSDFVSRQSCPLKYTNVLSNTNLFSMEEQEIIRNIFVKYKNVTTNSGPPGTMLADLYKTNYVIKTKNRTVDVENIIANFQYTNLDAHERIKLLR